jgi:hypothetical protein
VEEAAALGVNIPLFDATVTARRKAAEQEAAEEAQRLAQERSAEYHNALFAGEQLVTRAVEIPN